MAHAAVAPVCFTCTGRAATTKSLLSRLSSIFTSTRYSSSSSSRLHSLPRALRPSGISEGSGDEDGSDDEASPVKKSRNALKREARRAVQWGMELSAFSAPKIKRVLKVASLDGKVFEALMLVKRLGPDVREGRRRQFNYIGSLLRGVKPELMDALIQASRDGDDGRLVALTGQEAFLCEDDGDENDEITYEEEGFNDYVEVATRWLDGLIYKDPFITKEVYSLQCVDFDRQELRKLIRKVQSIQEGHTTEENADGTEVKLTKAKKPLIRFLRSLAKKSLA